MPVEISIIIPVFNEADNIVPLAREVNVAFLRTNLSYEIVFVDDGSSDATWQRIEEANRENWRVRGLRHERNAGQSAALCTGIQATQGPIIATLDGDRQNDPADLPRMLLELERYDFVCGKRFRREDTFMRRLSSRVARWARRVVLKADFEDTGCATRVFKRSSLKGVFAFNGLHRFLPVIVHGGGASTLEMPVNHRPRVAGESKYGVWDRLWRGIYDLYAVGWYQKRRLNPVPFTESTSAPAPPTEEPPSG